MSRIITTKPDVVKVEATSTEVSPVTHTALVEINKESTHEIPFIVQRGSINRPVPIIIIIKKLPAKIKEGFVLRPNNLTKPLDRLKKEKMSKSTM
jgi:hypothetical protein